MTSPFTGGEVLLIKEPREVEFRGSKFHIVHHSYQCVDTGEKFTDTRLDELNVNQVYNQYREKEGIPFFVRSLHQNAGETGHGRFGPPIRFHYTQEVHKPKDLLFE